MEAILSGAVMALTITTAWAAEGDLSALSANNWLPLCKGYLAGGDNKRDLMSQGYCAGAVYGIAFEGCARVPNDVTLEQMVRVVVRYVEARPQRMHEPFVLLAHEALIDAWPCKP
jgi:hypothetical protein